MRRNTLLTRSTTYSTAVQIFDKDSTRARWIDRFVLSPTAASHDRGVGSIFNLNYFGVAEGENHRNYMTISMQLQHQLSYTNQARFTHWCRGCVQAAMHGAVGHACDTYMSLVVLLVLYKGPKAVVAGRTA